MLSRTVRPVALEDMPQHAALKGRIVQHSVIYGAEGCGKLTLCQCWLASIYGQCVNQMQRRTLDIRHTGVRPVEIPFFSSDAHVIVDAPTCNSIDKTALQQFVREISATRNVVSMARGAQHAAFQHKVIVIQGADALSNGSQSALRDILEKQAESCRIILLARSLAHLQEVIISRCLKIKMRTDIPRMQEQALQICASAGITLQAGDAGLLDGIVTCARGNWRQVLNAIDYVRHGVARWQDVASCVDERGVVALRIARNVSSLGDEAARGALAGRIDGMRELVHGALSVGIAPSWLLSSVCETLVGMHPECGPALLAAGAECDCAMAQGVQPILFFDRFALEAGAAIRNGC